MLVSDYVTGAAPVAEPLPAERLAWIGRLAAGRVRVAVALVGCAALAVLFRLPFLYVPLTQDEGGYAYIARLWAHGARLYDTAWVDRPQGLIILFRLFTDVAPTTAGLRLAGALYVALSTLALAYVGLRLFGPTAAWCAALLFGFFSSDPQIEGFTINGELMATLPTILAIALALRAARTRRPAGWLVSAGFCAGGALLVKQSAIDAIAVTLLCAWSWRDGTIAQRAGRAALVALGATIALLLSALHGALTGWQRYLDAVVLDNLRYRGATSQPLGHALAGVKYLWGGNALLVVAAVVGAAILCSRRERGAPLALAWLIVAIAGMSLGGLFSRHYFVQVIPPLCLLAAEGLTWLARHARRLRWSWIVVAALVLSAADTVWADAPFYVGAAPLAVSKQIYNWPEYNEQAELVRVIDAHVPPGRPVYVVYSAPELHYLTGRPSVTPYLWRRPLGELPGAYDALLRTVANKSTAPACILIAQNVVRPPGDERMRDAILRYYRKTWQGIGVSFYCRIGRS